MARFLVSRKRTTRGAPVPQPHLHTRFIENSARETLFKRPRPESRITPTRSIFMDAIRKANCTIGLQCARVLSFSLSLCTVNSLRSSISNTRALSFELSTRALIKFIGSAKSGARLYEREIRFAVNLDARGHCVSPIYGVTWDLIAHCLQIKLEWELNSSTGLCQVASARIKSNKPSL